MVDVIVVGGGASGLLSAGRLASRGAKVVLVEKNDIVGKKLLITGKGRCNVTNKCDVDCVVKNVVVNGRFLYSSLNRFSPEDVINFFESRKVSLKVERGNRVFPVSDRASDIVKALLNFCKEYGVRILNKAVYGVVYREEKVIGVRLKDGVIFGKNVIVATGGMSYPQTGSTGDGYIWAKQAGHKLLKISPSLVPIITVEKWPMLLQGLSLKNVKLSVIENDKNIFEEQGEMLFTHFGISGPLVLSASSHIRNIEHDKYKIVLDLKPALNYKKLNDRVVREVSKFPNYDMVKILGKLLPAKMVESIFSMLKLNKGFKANQFSREQRKRLLDLLKKLTLTVKSFRSVEYAIITSGGVDVSEISPKTMESRIKKGLYFVGEILNVDGYTGGFNLQIAWSTAVAAADAIAEGLKRGGD